MLHQRDENVWQVVGPRGSGGRQVQEKTWARPQGQSREQPAPVGARALGGQNNRQTVWRWRLDSVLPANQACQCAHAQNAAGKRSEARYRHQAQHGARANVSETLNFTFKMKNSALKRIHIKRDVARFNISRASKSSIATRTFNRCL